MKKLLGFIIALFTLLSVMPAFAEPIFDTPVGEPYLDGPVDGLESEKLIGEGERAYDGSIDSDSRIALYDADNGVVLYEQNPETRTYPASTTKMMTTLLGIESGDLDQMITVGTEVNLSGTWSTMTPQLVVGETISLRDLIYGVLLPSGCEAAAAVGVAIGGTTAAFVSRMNARATALGMRGTHYVNANGVTNSSHYTTALDSVKLAKAAMNNSFFRQVVCTPEYHTAPTNMTGARTLTNTNHLLDPADEYYYPYAIGVKTGTTTSAKYCLVSAAKKNGRTLICAVMYAPSNEARYGYTRSLLNWGFGHCDPAVTTAFFASCEDVNVIMTVPNGCTYYYAPAVSSEYILGTADAGRKFLIKCGAYGADGRLWYLTNEGYFIPASSLNSADTSVVWGYFSDPARPLPSGTHDVGSSFAMGGVIYCNHYIDSAYAKVLNADGECVLSCTYEPSETYFDIERFNGILDFGRLPVGQYHLTIGCVSKNSVYKKESNFTMTGPCTVTFLGYGGIILKRQVVDYGGAAEAPSAPQISGMAFVGWDRDFSCVTSDITVNAIYAESTSSHALAGDVNGDGEVSFADISILYDYLIGGYELSAPYVQNADHNGDGTVDFSDIASIYAACLFA